MSVFIQIHGVNLLLKKKKQQKIQTKKQEKIIGMDFALYFFIEKVYFFANS